MWMTMMDNEPRMVEITSGDWASFAEKVGGFSASLNDEEQVLLQTIITLAAAELDATAEEGSDENEDAQEFALRLHPGVNIKNRKTLVSNFKSSFSKLGLSGPEIGGPGPKLDSGVSTICIQ